ncbi:WRKY Transcription Factor [Stylosanthes scabra]|uniref:WRKY Transcription Factor n=1 Tax=Stylosanthes scabra TaxID=79078 RepID=A0ABU6ZF73_9FABA|nr:WRKY Transcription Factor [Stylosanthes scabra]
MEEVEQANRLAVESCHRVLSILSHQPRDQVQNRNLMVETGEAVLRFKKVVSLLHNGLGHARVRKHRKLQVPFSQSILLDNPNNNLNHDQSKKVVLRLKQASLHENSVQELGSSTVRNSLSLVNPSLELSSSGKSTINNQQGSSSSHYQFLHQQQIQQQRMFQQQQQQQQQMKNHAEMMFRRNNSGINLNFDSTSCTPTMSSTTRSFISSLSIDGSVANLDGNSFHLIGAPLSSDQNSQQHKRKCSARGDEGSVKCGSSARCHCSKKR